MRLAWATDIHLNFVEAPGRSGFYECFNDCDGVVITGDIGESQDVASYLKEMVQVLQRPIYYVLGNHDFYRGSIVKVRDTVAHLSVYYSDLIYLTRSGVHRLTQTTALVGHDGWSDGQLGDFANSDVLLNDYVLIEELEHWDEKGNLDKTRLGESLLALAAEAAEHLELHVAQAAKEYKRVIVATHVPPFREAAWYQGHTSDDNYLPHFSSKLAGEALLRVAQSFPNCELLVLCGHTHGGGEIEVTPNLHVITGEAHYGSPSIQRVFQLE